MISIGYLLTSLLAAQTASANYGHANIELVGHFTSIPMNHSSCGVLYVGTTTTFLEESSNKEILVVVPCLEMQTTTNPPGDKIPLRADHRYRIKVTTTEPKGLCCFAEATDLMFLTDIRDEQ